MSQAKKRRQGTAAVELAACLPVLVTIVLGAMQASSILYLKQGLTMAAYEGSLAAARADVSRILIENHAGAILTQLSIQGAQVEVLPAGNLADMPPGTQLTIRVTAPIGPNIAGPEIISPKDNHVAEVVCVK